VADKLKPQVCARLCDVNGKSTQRLTRVRGVNFDDGSYACEFACQMSVVRRREICFDARALAGQMNLSMQSSATAAGNGQAQYVGVSSRSFQTRASTSFQNADNDMQVRAADMALVTSIGETNGCRKPVVRVNVAHAACDLV